jgi:hypothetical protein
MTAMEPASPRPHLLTIYSRNCAARHCGRAFGSDIDTIGFALRAGLISPDQAVEHLSDCGILRLLGLREEQEAAA